MMLTSFVYWEHNPSSPALDSVWTIDVQRDCSGPLPYLTLPDGCLDLIYRQQRDASGKIDAAALLVAGPANRPSTYFPSPGEEFIGVRFAPGWGGSSLGLSATELACSFVGAANLTPALAQLEKQLVDRATRTEAVQLLSMTAEQWAFRAERHRRTLEAIRALRISGGKLHNLDDHADRARALKEMVRVLRPGGTILLTDIAYREEYQVEMKRLGLAELRLVVESPLRDRINKLVSFGSFRPATLSGRKL